MTDLRVLRLHHSASLPRYMSRGAAGLDLSACLQAPVILSAYKRLLIPTGLAIEIPPGNEGQIRPRSGLAAQRGVTVVNAPGTIDEDYRGEIMVALINLGKRAFFVEHGARIAQLVVSPVTRVDVVECAELSDTERAAGGFGSTDRAGKEGR